MIQYLLAKGAAANTAPATVDEALAGLTTALENLAAVKAEKASEAADLKAQAEALAHASADAQAEADRAERIHGNISTLLA